MPRCCTRGDFYFSIEGHPMFNKGQLSGLMKQAQQMQDNLKRVQDELGQIEVEGQSGAAW
jgi:Uncharacterized protein conserved in bacteria